MQVWNWNESTSRPVLDAIRRRTSGVAPAAPPFLAIHYRQQKNNKYYITQNDNYILLTASHQQ